LITQADGAAYHRERLAEAPDRFGADVRQRLETGSSSRNRIFAGASNTSGDENLVSSSSLTNMIFSCSPLRDPCAAYRRQRPLWSKRVASPLYCAVQPERLPAISIPCGFNHEGLPIGLQLLQRLGMRPRS